MSEDLSSLTISTKEMQNIEELLTRLLNDTSADVVLLLDKSGQVVTTRGNIDTRNLVELGALLAGAFSSSKEIAKLLKETEFKNIYQQGARANIYTSLIGDAWLLSIIFDKLTHIGLVKVLAKRATDMLTEVLGRVRSTSQAERQAVLN